MFVAVMVMTVISFWSTLNIPEEAMLMLRTVWVGWGLEVVQSLA